MEIKSISKAYNTRIQSLQKLQKEGNILSDLYITNCVNKIIDKSLII